MHGAQSWRVWR